MANTISLTTAAANVPQIWANRGLEALVNNAVLPRIVNRTWDPEFRQKGDRVNILNPLNVSANAKVVQTDITLQTPTYANTTIQLTKHYEASAAIEDVAKTLMLDGNMSMFTDAAMKSLATQIDVDLVAEAANFSGGPVGVQGVAATAATLRAARKVLLDAKAPVGGRFACVIGSATESDLLGQDLFIQANTSGDNGTALSTARLGTKYGFDIYVDQNISSAGGGNKNIAFVPEALALASAALFDPSSLFSGAVISAVQSDPTTGMGIRLTMSWDQQKLATIMTYDVLYGVKVVRPTLGTYAYGSL